MTVARAALLALLIAASGARAQPSDASDVTPPMRAAVTAYRAGDLDAAEQALRRMPGDADAEAWLGAVLVDRGRVREAMPLLQHAADAGSSEGAHRLALIYAEGAAGTPRNDARALELFERAAAAGHRRAQINVGTMYFRGQGTARDLMRARAWLEKAAAAQDDAYALYALGRALDEGQGTVMADPVRAADLYRRAAQLGHPLAALRYGLALSEGNGVRQDFAAAQSWLLQAGKGGVPEAAMAIGDLAARLSVTRDKAARQANLQLAVAWYEVAAMAGVASAQFKLANAYLAGAGVARDPQQAQQWYVRAAAQGSPEAQYGLGLFLIGGVSGAADPVEGYKWLVLAERGGYADSQAAREKAGEKIGEADRKRAEALADKFVAQRERPADDAPPRLVAPARP
jgi:TPR repeat protein